MGNLQSDVKSNKAGKQGKVKQLMKIRGKKGKSDDVSFTCVVPEDAETQEEEEEEHIQENNKRSSTMVVTDSWCKVNQEQPSDVLSPGAESSSDSVFVDPLTPVAFSTEINQCYQSEEEEENFSAVLNSFKLNHYNKAKQDVITQKLSKLGVCKTSQISLDAAGEENFDSGNVEVVRKEETATTDLVTENDDIRDEVQRQKLVSLSDDVLNNGKCNTYKDIYYIFQAFCFSIAKRLRKYAYLFYSIIQSTDVSSLFCFNYSRTQQFGKMTHKHLSRL